MSSSSPSSNKSLFNFELPKLPFWKCDQDNNITNNNNNNQVKPIVKNKKINNVVVDDEKQQRFFPPKDLFKRMEKNTAAKEPEPDRTNRRRYLVGPGAGAGAGIGCGAGVGFGLLGGPGYTYTPWNKAPRVVFGLGTGCGVGVGAGFGYGVGLGKGMDWKTIWHGGTVPRTRTWQWGPLSMLYWRRKESWKLELKFAWPDDDKSDDTKAA